MAFAPTKLYTLIWVNYLKKAYDNLDVEDLKALIKADNELNKKYISNRWAY